jgi:hypothetical protein
MDDFKNFIEAVAEMREAQVTYFKSAGKDRDALILAKSHERTVDAMLKRLTRDGKEGGS